LTIRQRAELPSLRARCSSPQTRRRGLAWRHVQRSAVDWLYLTVLMHCEPDRPPSF